MSKFSIGYNGMWGREFLQILKPYESQIESIYFSAPHIIGAHHKMDKTSEARTKLTAFLDMDIPYKRFLTVNNVPLGKFTDDDAHKIQLDLIPFLTRYKVDGVIVADLRTAMEIRKYMPDILIDTSCNAFMFTTREMRMWEKEVGVNCFNPPREILRMPSLLKEMKECGFKLKCIVNESCSFGCPSSRRHNSFVASQETTTSFANQDLDCLANDEANILRSNWVLPRWLPELSQYVDIFKISTRTFSVQRMIRVLDAYCNQRDDLNLDDFIFEGTVWCFNQRHPNVKFSTKEIPDKLLTCQCRDCYSKCNLCKTIIERKLKDNE